MASAGELKQLLNQLASDSENTSGDVQQFSNDFDEQAQSIQAALEGTSTGADQEIAQIFQQAQQSLTETVQALQQAAQAAREYAEQI
ncbi:hypothetical protein QUW48_07010 [Bifidobacterium pullorum]|uniref:hypothetical protein n=1 Tax=Bifidobacterium pullorum TaxID=78448 RepID=UPI0025A4A6DB|nr:hypothetical protein [Bifidobacterium pullorum]MDM8323284.1 hypothetical protein [Bifidobacterium pullorum]